MQGFLRNPRWLFGISEPSTVGSMGRLYIYLHEGLILMGNGGKYTSPMDCLGYING